MIEPITAEDIQAAFSQLGVSAFEQPTAAAIISEVADAAGLTPDDLKGHCSARRIAWPRFCAMSRIRKETSLSLPQIGRALGGMDHTSIMHGIRRWEELSQQAQEQDT